MEPSRKKPDREALTGQQHTIQSGFAGKVGDCSEWVDDNIFEVDLDSRMDERVMGRVQLS